MRKNKKKKKNKSSLPIIIVAGIAIISFVIFSNSGGSFAGDVFSKSKRASSKKEASIPPELRWEKDFRFSSGKEKQGGGNFLQYQAQQNNAKNSDK